tara:strand:+ start:5221 stop:5418 length:198 start_codon:yes stop_codon:yes gene_type:complete
MREYNLGEQVTAKITLPSGEEDYVSGEVASVSNDIIFIISKFPRKKYYSIKRENIITKNEENKNG